MLTNYSTVGISVSTSSGFPVLLNVLKSTVTGGSSEVNMCGKQKDARYFFEPTPTKCLITLGSFPITPTVRHQGPDACP